MSSTQRLEFRQGQSLIMTPQLLQSIKLLQLSHLELAAFIDAELERNPLLQHADDAPDGAPLDAKIRPSQPPETIVRRIFPQAGARYAQGLSAGKTAQAGGSVPSDAASGVGVNLPGMVSLAQHLETQLDLATADPLMRHIGRHLIHSLNEAGYLVETVDDIAEALAVTRDSVMRALKLVQTFDPPGIGARHLAECLALQLRERGGFEASMETLLGRLDLVARRDFVALRRLCDVSEEELAAMLAEIRSLEPKPGLVFGDGTVDVLVPDVFVRENPDGSFAIELNGTTMPRLFVDRAYHASIAQAARSEADQAFVAECAKSAQWLARSLEQRATTILKVATEILRQQAEFFRGGAAHLRPMTLRSVAEVIGMHESTISRVTANKAVGTPRGTFPMKYFFSTALPGTKGADAHSSEAVRHRIKAMIASERTSAVLSDDAIARSLKASGIAIARRTVAKYRESLRIPTSAQRRRQARPLHPKPP